MHLVSSLAAKHADYPQPLAILRALRQLRPKHPLTLCSASDYAAMPTTDLSCCTTSSFDHMQAPRGHIHLKLIQARALTVSSAVHSTPYVVVQFEQNEFVSRHPIPESSKELRGTPVTLAHSSLERASRKGSSSSIASVASTASANSSLLSSAAASLFGRLSPHNPVWKHQVSFDVTSEHSLVTCTVYDHSTGEHRFLGRVQVKPLLIHDHTVDQWYKLQPIGNERVSGDLHLQITYEQPPSPKILLTPRDFDFLKLIGRGTFGKVFQVRKRDTHRIYAMKVLSKKEIIAKKEVAHTIGERKILQRGVESPFLVGLKFSFQTERDLYLITDFKSGGELFWHLQRETKFPEERAKFYVAELILALEHLHKYDIVYRDLKPENILLDATGHVALCDFGLSKPDLRSDELTTTFCGTTEYLAPEILLDEQGYSKIVDFWSLGVLLFEMCCGWSPFYAEDTQQMYKNICFGKVRFPKGVIDEEGKMFVKGLLNRNPKHRLGAQRDAAELKAHPYFAATDWEALARKEVTPPFKPIVESDDSTSNFDKQFTEADISGVVGGLGGYRYDQVEMDDDDPSESWVERSIAHVAHHHTPNGPLGSDRPHNNGVGTPHLHAAAAAAAASSTTPTSNSTKGIDIKPRGKRKEFSGHYWNERGKEKGGRAESPTLSRSVQENFRGFTYHGRESVGGGVGTMHSVMRERERKRKEEADEDEDEDEDEEKENGSQSEDTVKNEDGYDEDETSDSWLRPPSSSRPEKDEDEDEEDVYGTVGRYSTRSSASRKSRSKSNKEHPADKKKKKKGAGGPKKHVGFELDQDDLDVDGMASS